MIEWDDETQEKRNEKRLRLIQIIVVAVILLILGISFFIYIKRDKNSAGDTVTRMVDEGGLTAAEGLPIGTDITAQDEQDPQYAVEQEEALEEEVDVQQWITSMSGYETEALCTGIDVAKWQGIIDWQQVADAGVEFAMIRIGYRTQKTGVITEDPLARYNLQEATAAGIQIGVYFFSTAVNEAEAQEEADWVCDFIAQYPITYPVAYNCEGFQQSENRQFGLTIEARTNIAIAFLDRIAEHDYTPMFYAARNELANSLLWDTARLEGRYKIWVARYGIFDGQISQPDYSGEYAMWQYTNNGSIAGIPKPVDVNIAYFSYSQNAGVKNSDTPDKVSANLADLMNFTEVNETVTAKDVTNLRNEPSTDKPETVVTRLKNGEQATRTGIDHATGWSRLSYNGQTLYAVSQYLTTDLGYQPAQSDTASGSGTGTESTGGGGGTVSAGTTPEKNDNSVTTLDGNVVTFTNTDDYISPKNEVNLRGEPSTSAGNDTIHYRLPYGEVVHRTGIAEAQGWSRVEYNGEILYAVTSYMYVVEPPGH